VLDGNAAVIEIAALFTIVYISREFLLDFLATISPISPTVRAAERKRTVNRAPFDDR